MKIILAVSLLLSPAFVLGAIPSAASVEKLMVLTDVDKMISVTLRDQVTGIIDGTIAVETKNKQIDAEGRKVLDAERERLIAYHKSEIGWAKMKEAYIPLYQEKFSQEEIDGMIAFFESPAGKAYLGKLPGVGKQCQKLMRDALVPVIARIQADVRKCHGSLENQPLGVD